MKTKFPWLKLRKKTHPEIPLEPPLWMGNQSNGEYFHTQTRYEKKLRQFVLEKADENARRTGMDRREFLASAMGMATTLWCINYATGCSSDESGGGGKGGGGALCVPPEAMYDEAAACTAIGGDQFIFDVQTHWFSQEDTVRFPQSVKDIFGVLFAVANEDSYIRGMFLESDTAVAVLTSWPGTYCSEDAANTDPCGLPLSNDSMARSRDRINALACNTERVIQHFQVLPNDTTALERQMELMTQLHCEQRVAGWKMYPGFASQSIDPRGSEGYFLTDQNARTIIEHGLKLGVKRFSVHKGLPIGNFFEQVHNHPRDVGPTAKDYPEATFIIYHSGICSGFSQCDAAFAEGPYDPAEAEPKGVNAFIRSLQDAGIQSGQNVYAEVGSAIDRVRNNATQAAHFFGKLMKYVGVDRVVWGTDSVIGGSPQGLIEWFRNLEITPQMQAEHGYPPLDDTNKRKILGLNAAALYGIDVDAKRCQVDACPTAVLKRQLDEEFGPRRWAFQRPGGPQTWEEFVEDSRKARALGRPG